MSVQFPLKKQTSHRKCTTISITSGSHVLSPACSPVRKPTDTIDTRKRCRKKEAGLPQAWRRRERGSACRGSAPCQMPSQRWRPHWGAWCYWPRLWMGGSTVTPPLPAPPWLANLHWCTPLLALPPEKKPRMMGLTRRATCHLQDHFLQPPMHSVKNKHSVFWLRDGWNATAMHIACCDSLPGGSDEWKR